MMTAEDWKALLLYCNVSPSAAEDWAPLFEQQLQADRFSAGIDDMDDFVGQILHESYYLERLTENLNYSPARLMQVWPTRFPSIETTIGYAWNPTALAEKVYGGRLGNDQPGDGAKYPGRGLIQATGKANYAAISKIMGIDFVAQPELMAEKHEALNVAIAWWEGHIPDSALGNIVRITKLVNGGVNGLSNRKTLTQRAKEMIHE